MRDSSIFTGELKRGIVSVIPFSYTSYASLYKLSALFVLGIELIRNSASTHTRITHNRDDQCQVSVATLNGLHVRDAS